MTLLEPLGFDVDLTVWTQKHTGSVLETLFCKVLPVGLLVITCNAHNISCPVPAEFL